MMCSIIPPYILRRLASLDDPAFASAAQAARASLLVDRPFRSIREGEAAPPTAPPGSPRQPGAQGRTTAIARPLADPIRSVSDAGGSEELPGRLVRSDENPTGDADDAAVVEAWDGLGHTHALFRDEYSRASIDDDNLPLEATVHFGRLYDNAFWNGERMVFGDGDGQVFTRMTASLSVIGHELAHGVTQYTAGLEYAGQSGALNESVSDVFGALVEQRTANQSVEEATWLIGVGLFTDDVEGEAIRSMKAPGTAYDDDILGKDPQPAHMDDYIETDDENGGVHLNSGIPNRAFYLTAEALGGYAWNAPGQIWYDTLTSGTLSATVDFAGFAEATTDAATQRFGADSAETAAVIAAWRTVGVTKDAPAARVTPGPADLG